MFKPIFPESSSLTRPQSSLMRNMLDTGDNGKEESAEFLQSLAPSHHPPCQTSF